MSSVNVEDMPPAAVKEPAYLQIARELRERIDSGALGINEPITAERELCLEWGVSRMTARRALGVLEREGRIYRDRTRGTFVSEPKVKLRLGSFSREVTRAGRHPGAELFWAKEMEAEDEVAHGLDIAVGNAVYALQRLRKSNGEPLALETTYYRQDMVPGLLAGDLSGSLWDELRQRFDLRVTRTVAELEVAVLDTEISRLLDTRRATAGLKLTRRTFVQDEQCVEYAVDIYRADRVSLILERSIDSD